jgi:hypothetical protein
LPPPTCSIGEMKTVHSTVMSHGVFIWPSAEITECWLVYPNITKEKKIAVCSHGALKVMHVVLERKWTVLDHPLPIGAVVNDHYYCTLLQDKVRLSVLCKQPEPRTAWVQCQSASEQCDTSLPWLCVKSGAMFGLRCWRILPPLQI